MSKIITATMRVFSPQSNPPSRILTVNPSRAFFIISNSGVSNNLWIANNTTDAASGGLQLGTNVQPLEVRPETYGQLVKQEWWIGSAAALPGPICIVEAFESPDFEVSTYATRIEYSPSRNSDSKRRILTSIGQPNRNSDIVPSDSRLYDIIRRCRRFRAGG